MMHSAGLHHSEQRLPVNKKNDEIYQTFCKITTLELTTVQANLDYPHSWGLGWMVRTITITDDMNINEPCQSFMTLSLFLQISEICCLLTSY